jgi:hypothetical protein
MLFCQNPKTIILMAMKNKINNKLQLKNKFVSLSELFILEINWNLMKTKFASKNILILIKICSSLLLFSFNKMLFSEKLKAENSLLY